MTKNEDRFASLFVYFLVVCEASHLRSAKFADFEVQITVMVLEELYHWEPINCDKLVEEKKNSIIPRNQ